MELQFRGYSPLSGKAQQWERVCDGWLYLLDSQEAKTGQEVNKARLYK